ncbi:MAG: DNA-binding transcriptional regulator [Calditrichaceae bacterium]|nr:DNA-binding transcriptional regulator [Calditrichaceae bacterium]MBN2710198.1 DNA-binding transcriptional regulator [Calditrichaceae bacterium]RQV94172.1 MAG: DNA-binding transcriptional regulator [Calditrichota bacterium]
MKKTEELPNKKTLPRVLLLLETSRAFGRELLYGIARYSRLHGPWAFYREHRGLTTAIPRIKNWQANGIIMRNSSITRQLIGLNIPTILAIHNVKAANDPDWPDYLPTLTTDNKNISRMAAEHLLHRGFKNYAYCGFDEFLWSKDRGGHFKKILDERNYRVHYYPYSLKYKSWDTELPYMVKWLNRLPKPVGIMTCNDDRGQQVIEACKQAGLDVPEEVSIIGVDNDALFCELCDPPLTSVALNIEQGGYMAAELLNRLMQGEAMKGQQIVLSPTHIVRRQSTDILSMDDKEVTAAIRYIRQNARECIKVDDVVNATALSRRSLELRFRKTLSRSIQKEIQRIRAELIAQMLIETEMSISEIASSLKFADIEHISRYFRKEKGMGLREFRKMHR